MALSISLGLGLSRTGQSQFALAFVAAATNDVVSFTTRSAQTFDVQNGYGVNGEGYVADVVIKTSNLAGTVDASKLTVVVTDPGFDGTGATVTRTRTIVGHAVLRKQYPNNTQRNIEANSDGGVLVRVVLSDYIYAGSTIVSATFAAGFYTGSNAGQAAYKSNGSTLAYFKPAFASLQLPNLRVSSSGLYSEVVAYHRHAMLGRQVACIGAIDKDTSGNATAEQIVSTPILSTLITQGFKPECYAHQIAPTALNQGELCYRNFRVYPWIGDESAVLDLGRDGVQTGAVDVTTAQNQTRLRYVNDKTGAYGGAYAYVRPGLAYTSSGHFNNSSSYAPARAFDGSTVNFFYSTAIADPYLAVTLPGPLNIREVRITADTSGFHGSTPTTPVVEYSDDGSTWTQKGSAAAFSAWTAGATQSLDLGAGGTAHKYWRLRRPGGSTSMSIGEMALATSVGGVSVVTPLATTVVSDAAQAPFASPDAAIAAIKVYNNANKGHNDIGGGIVRLMDDGLGGNVAHSFAANLTTTAAPGGKAWCVIEQDPANVGVASFTATSTKNTPEMLLVKVPIIGAAFPIFYSGGTVQNTFRIAFDGCSCAMAGQTNFRLNQDYGIGWIRNCTQTDNSGWMLALAATGTTKHQWALAAGCVATVSSKTVNAHTAIGNQFSGIGFDAFVYAGNEIYDGMVFANNRFLAVPGNTVVPSSVSSTRTAAFVQNVYEGISSSATTFNISADGTFGNVYDILDHHFLVLGERSSRMYADNTTTRGQLRRMTTKYSIVDYYNIKTDTFAPGVSGNTGNWAYAYGTGSKGHIAIKGGTDGSTAANPDGGVSGGGTGGSGGYLGMYWDPTSSTVVASGLRAAMFTDPQALGWGSGTGNGTYTLAGATNPAYDRVPAGEAVLAYDLAGVARLNNGTGAAGPYERP